MLCVHIIQDSACMCVVCHSQCVVLFCLFKFFQVNLAVVANTNIDHLTKERSNWITGFMSVVFIYRPCCDWSIPMLAVQWLVDPCSDCHAHTGHVVIVMPIPAMQWLPCPYKPCSDCCGIDRLVLVVTDPYWLCSMVCLACQCHSIPTSMCDFSPTTVVIRIQHMI